MPKLFIGTSLRLHAPSESKQHYGFGTQHADEAEDSDGRHAARDALRNSTSTMAALKDSGPIACTRKAAEWPP